MSYQGVMSLTRDPGTSGVDWLKVIRGCYEEAKMHGGNRFAANWVYRRQKTGWFPNLQRLVKYGILRQVGDSKIAYYEMPDIKGVARALDELGYFQE